MWSSLTCSTSVTRGIRRASWHARRTIRPPQVTNRVQRWGGGLPLSHAPRHMATQAQQLYTEAFFEDVWCILRGDAVLIMQLLGDRSLLPEACACPAFPMCRAPPSARQPPLLEAIHAQNGRPSFGGQPYHDSGKLVRRQTMKRCSLATSSHVLVDTSHISGGGNA